MTDQNTSFLVDFEVPECSQGVMNFILKDEFQKLIVEITDIVDEELSNKILEKYNMIMTDTYHTFSKPRNDCRLCDIECKFRVANKE